MSQFRNRYHCPVCGSAVVRLTQHIVSQHARLLGSEYRCRLFANHRRLDGKERTDRGRLYRVCPVPMCAAITANIPVHLRTAHSFSTPSSLTDSSRAQRVSHLDWSIPVEPDCEERSEASSRVRDPSQHGSETGPEHPETSPVNSSIGSPSSVSDAAIRRPSPDVPPTKEQRPVSPHQKTVFEGPRGVSSITNEWRHHMITERGGSTKPERALEYARAVDRYLQFHDLSESPAAAASLDRIDMFVANRRSIGCSTSAAWKASLLGYLAKFFKFLALSHIGKMEATVLRDFLASIVGTRTSVQRRRRTDRVEKASRERTSVMAPDMELLLNSTCVQSCITRLSECTDTSTYSNVRGIIACMIVRSGARPSAIAGLTLTEVASPSYQTEGGVGYAVLSVTDHKTAQLGPFNLVLTLPEYRSLRKVREFLLRSFRGITHPFVSLPVDGSSEGGKPYNSARIGKVFGRVWAESGCQAKYGTYNATMNRKRIATQMATDHPQLREQTARQLRHSATTEAIYYDLGDAPRGAARIASLTKRKKASETPAPPSTEVDQTVSVQATSKTRSCSLPPRFSGSNMEPFERASSEPMRLVDYCLAPVTGTSCPTAACVETTDFDPVTTGPVAGTSCPTSAWVETQDFSQVPTSVNHHHQQRPSVIFESVSTVMRGGVPFQRRKWTEDSNRRFASDWAVEIVLCEATGKKASLVVIKRKLEQLDLQNQWSDLSPANIRDKIVTEVKRRTKKDSNKVSV